MSQKILTVHYTNNGVMATGLSPTVIIYELDPINPNINTIVVNNGALTEIGQGWYRYDFLTYDYRKSYVFTFDGGIFLTACDRYKIGGNDSFVEDISSEVWNEQETDHQALGSTGLAISQVRANTETIVIGQVAAQILLETLIKYQANRTRVNATAKTLTIYDDDCTTPLQVFDLRDSFGNPSVTEVCERVPQTCP
jgi:hypothetical protein